MNIIEEIAEERSRQWTEEGWTKEHDDEHNDNSLSIAAASYCLETSMIWPWELETFKLKDRRRNLIRAAALIVAEIERMDRETNK